MNPQKHVCAPMCPGTQILFDFHNPSCTYHPYLSRSLCVLMLRCARPVAWCDGMRRDAWIFLPWYRFAFLHYSTRDSH